MGYPPVSCIGNAIVKQPRKTITFPQNFISAGLPARGDRPVRIVAGLPASESSYVSNIVFSEMVVNVFLYLHLIAL